MAPPNVLLVTKGHPFQRDPFFQMWDALQSEGLLTWTHVEQPAAQLFFHPEISEPYDVIVDYSMPGVFGVGGNPDPPQEFKDNFLAMLELGKPMIMIHHNLCSWPGWEEYAEIVGGRFHYHPGSLRGVDYPDSGWLLAVEHNVSVVDPEHPVTQGIEDGFAIQDELYLAPVFEEDVLPLLRSDWDFNYRNFFSAVEVVDNGRMYSRGDWTHPPTSNLIAWAKNYANSPIVYIEPGDVPTSYNNPNYRKLIGNAVSWVTTDDASSWARERNLAKV